jgi:hypothetical protein
VISISRQKDRIREVWSTLAGMREEKAATASCGAAILVLRRAVADAHDGNCQIPVSSGQVNRLR